MKYSVGDPFVRGSIKGKVVGVSKGYYSIETTDDEGNVITVKVKIKDSSDSDRQAELAISTDEVYDLYTYGKLKLNIPSGTNPKDFAESCISLLDELWGDPEVNFEFGKVKFSYDIAGDKLFIYTED